MNVVFSQKLKDAWGDLGREVVLRQGGHHQALNLHAHDPHMETKLDIDILSWSPRWTNVLVCEKYANLVETGNEDGI